MSLMDKMMEFMVDRMSKDEKKAMMDQMMDKMLADFTTKEKQKMIEEMMPRMMEGVDLMEMMPKMMMKMMGGSDEMPATGEMSGMMKEGFGADMPMMPKMMTTMMPQCLNVMLPYVPKEKRTDFVSRMVSTLMGKSSEGMTEEEKKAFMDQIKEVLKG